MGLYNLIFIMLGIISMSIGVVGIIIPVLPTTPFLILASLFFIKGSDRFDLWFRNTKLYKDYAEDFLKDRSMTLKRKIKIMLISDFMLLFPLITIDNLLVRWFIILMGVCKYYYFIFKIKTK